jgi:tetratricopeptide (TPR) repeat protein
MKATKSKRAAGYADDTELETAFFEGLVRRDPNYTEALQLLGECYTRQGQWRKALRVDQRLAQLCPKAPMVQYNLACSYSLLNKLPEALIALKNAIDLGFDDFSWLSQDPDLANLRQWLETEPLEKVKAGAKKTIPIEDGE